MGQAATMLRASVTANNPATTPGASAQVLIDGSDTAVTANGLTNYTPTPGDRLLVTRVGSQVEVVQFLNRGTIPYLSQSDISDLAAEVANHDDAISSQGATLATTQDSLVQFQTDTNTALTQLQGAYDVLSGIGAVGVQEDYIWVGNDPALSTVKSVQISTYVQGGLNKTDFGSFSSYFNLWDQVDIGDVTYQGSLKSPMTQVYNTFTTYGISAQPYK